MEAGANGSAQLATRWRLGGGGERAAAAAKGNGWAAGGAVEVGRRRRQWGVVCCWLGESLGLAGVVSCGLVGLSRSGECGVVSLFGNSVYLISES